MLTPMVCFVSLSPSTLIGSCNKFTLSLCYNQIVLLFRPPGFVEFDITVAMRNWQSGDSNYGVLLMATNEEALGRDIRFTSKTSPNSNQHAYVNVLCDY